MVHSQTGNGQSQVKKLLPQLQLNMWPAVGIIQVNIIVTGPEKIGLIHTKYNCTCTPIIIFT